MNNRPGTSRAPAHALLINTPFQRGGRAHCSDNNRFSGFRLHSRFTRGPNSTNSTGPASTITPDHSRSTKPKTGPDASEIELPQPIPRSPLRPPASRPLRPSREVAASVRPQPPPRPARQDKPGWADLGEIKRNWTQKNITAPENMKTAMPHTTGSAGIPAGEFLPTPPQLPRRARAQPDATNTPKTPKCAKTRQENEH
jgi:hypothetical protein